MSVLISESRPIARKPHRCGAYEWIMETYEDGSFTYQELRQIAKVRRNKGMIMPGQKYIRQAQIYEGDFCVFKALPDMDEICRKYDIYPDW